MTSTTYYHRVGSSEVIVASASLSFGYRQWRRFTVSMVTILAAMIMVPAPAWADSIRQQQWFLDTLNIPAAQQISTGAGVTVAVIDSGVDTTHPDLQGQLVPGKCLAEFLDPRWDLEGHGTAMAGLIAAKGGGDDHALGVAPGAKILPICIDGSHIDAYVALREIAQGIHYAVDHCATVTHEGSSGRNNQNGYGLVNPVQALTASVPTVTANPLGTPPPIAPAASQGTTATAKAHNAGFGDSAITLIWALVGVGLIVALVVITLLVRRRREHRQQGQEWAGAYPTARQGSQLQESRQSPSPGPGSAGHS